MYSSYISEHPCLCMYMYIYNYVCYHVQWIHVTVCMSVTDFTIHQPRHSRPAGTCKYCSIFQHYIIMCSGCGQQYGWSGWWPTCSSLLMYMYGAWGHVCVLHSLFLDVAGWGTTHSQRSPPSPILWVKPGGLEETLCPWMVGSTGHCSNVWGCVETTPPLRVQSTWPS